MNRKSTTILIVVIAIVFLLALVAAIVAATLIAARVEPFGGDRVALIRMEGVITSGRGSRGLLGGGVAGSERIVGILEEFRKDNSVKSAVLRINSPGGSAAASQEVYREIMRVRKSGKKITVSMGDVAASGGYYVASAADRIYADPATVTGSIGVIMETADLHELLERIGIDFGVIKSGKHKDMGSFSRAMTAEERKILQAVIDDVYDQFVTDVSKGRKLPKDQVRKLADGRIYTGRQALKLKLVDRLGTLEDALKAAASDAGIKGEFGVKEYERQLGLFDVLFGPTDVELSGWFQPSDALREFAERLLRIDSGSELR